MKKIDWDIDLNMDRRQFIKTAAVTAGAVGLGSLGIIGATGCSGTSGNRQVLARVEVTGDVSDLKLPVHAELEDVDEIYYVLVIAGTSELNEAGVKYRVLDYYAPGVRYLIGWEDEDDVRQEAAKKLPILYDDGEHIIIRYKSELSDILPQMGFKLKLMSKTPLSFDDEDINTQGILEGRFAPASLEQNSHVQKMITGITEDNIRSHINALTGETAVLVDGSEYTFKTRHTKSGEPIDKATQYIHNRLKALNISSDFQKWTTDDNTLSNRNVIGEIPGQTKSKEIVILIAHLDSISNDEDGRAPGADDNASGCVALLAAAEMMKNYTFQRTVRFVFTTGEEQAIHGGEYYAEWAAKQNQNIYAVINLDMISYSKQADSDGRRKQQVKTRNKTHNKNGYAKDAKIANTYLDVVNTYAYQNPSVNADKLSAVLNSFIEDDGEAASDHSPFWDKKYGAIWLIEYAERGFINSRMHTKNDRVKDVKDDVEKDYLNLRYFTAIVKATTGATAHLAEIIDVKPVPA